MTPQALVPDVSEFIVPAGCPVQVAIDSLDDEQLAVNVTAAMQLKEASPLKIARRLGVDEKAVRRHRDRECRCVRGSHD